MKVYFTLQIPQKSVWTINLVNSVCIEAEAFQLVTVSHIIFTHDGEVPLPVTSGG